MTGSFLSNAALGASKGKHNTFAARMQGRPGTAAWFFLVACILSITLRALDQWLFSDEDAGTSELCAFGAFVVGAIVSLRSRARNTAPDRNASKVQEKRDVLKPSNDKIASIPSSRRPPSPPCNGDRERTTNSRKGSDFGVSPSFRRSRRSTDKDCNPEAVENTIEQILKSEDAADTATLAHGVVGCCKVGKFDLAEKWLAKLLRMHVDSPKAMTRITKETAHSLITSCLEVGQLHRATVWLGQLHAGGMSPSANTITMVLDVSVKEGSTSQAEQLLLRLLLANAAIDATCYQILFTHCIPSDDIARVETWLQRISDVGKSQLTQAYIALIRTRAQVGDTFEAERWLSKAVAAGVARSTHCYNAVIHACVREGDVVRAEKWLKHMERASLENILEPKVEGKFSPDVISYSAIMDAYAQQGKTEQAEEWFRRMISAGIRPDGVSFNTVIKAHARNGNVVGAERWLLCARKHGVILDSFGYNAVIAAAARANEPKAAENWLHQMIKDGSQPDVVSYNSVINAWAKRGEATAAERLVRQMCAAFVEPDVVTLGAATHACARSGDSKKAEAIFDAIVSRGKARPDVICFNALIDACVKAGDTRRAEFWLSEMVGEGVSPSVVSYTTVIHAHARSGNVDAAEQGLERMLTAGVEANVVSYSALIGACAKAGDVERAERWFDRMRKAGIRGNNVSYSVLLNVCAKAGDHERAEKWLEGMCADGVAPNAVCFNNVIDACAKAGLPDRAEMWLQRLCQASRKHPGNISENDVITVEGAASTVRPTRQSFTTAAQAYATRGSWNDAERIIEEMERLGMSMDEFSLTVLLSAYSRGRPRQRERGEAAFRRHAAAGLPITKPPLRVLRSLVGSARFEVLCNEMQIRIPTDCSGRAH